MYRNDVYDANGLVERVQVDRTGAGGTPRYRRWLAADLVNPVEDRAPTTAELQLLLSVEETEDRAAAVAAAQAAALQALHDWVTVPSGMGDHIITMFVASGSVSLEDARAVGWTPP